MSSPSAFEPAAPRGGAPARWTLTLGLLSIVSMTAFEALAAATVLPAVVGELGGMEWYGGAFSGFMLMNVVSIVLGGRRIDAKGVLGPFLAGSTAFVVGLVLSGVAPSMPVVVAGRMVQGFGAGAISSVAYVAVARGYDADEKPRMLALLSSAWVVPGLIGPGVAAQVAELAGWRVVFLGLAPLVVLAAVIALPGLARLLVPAEPPAPAGLRELCVAGAVEPGRVRVARAALLVMGLLTWSFFSAEAFVPLTLTTLRGASLTGAGLALTAGTLAWTAGAWIQERLARRGRHGALVRSGLALLTLGVALFAALLEPRVPGFTGVAAWGVAGLGMGIAFSTVSLVVLGVPAPGREGVAAAALQLANVLGFTAGTGVGGGLVALALATGRSQAVGVGATFVVVLVASVTAFFLAGRLGGGAPPHPGEPAPPLASGEAP